MSGSSSWRKCRKGLVLRQYAVSEAFAVSEYIEHPTFGTGKVLDTTGAERVPVIFKDGRKTLICNRSKAPKIDQ